MLADRLCKFIDVFAQDVLVSEMEGSSETVMATKAELTQQLTTGITQLTHFYRSIPQRFREKPEPGDDTPAIFRNLMFVSAHDF